MNVVSTFWLVCFIVCLYCVPHTTMYSDSYRWIYCLLKCIVRLLPCKSLTNILRGCWGRSLQAKQVVMQYHIYLAVNCGKRFTSTKDTHPSYRALTQGRQTLHSKWSAILRVNTVFKVTFHNIPLVLSHSVQLTRLTWATPLAPSNPFNQY